jgi:glycosyltransferase involved in cell wall biosynthesis
VTDGESALLVKPGHPEALSCALATLLEDGELRARLAEGGRHRFREQFAAEGLIDALRRTYAELGFPP